MMTQCEYCEGTGEIEVFWDEMRTTGMSNEQACDLAGSVHHVETCEYCDGEGEYDNEEEDDNEVEA